MNPPINVIHLPFDVPELHARAGDFICFNPETRRFVVFQSIGPSHPSWRLAWQLMEQMGRPGGQAPLPQLSGAGQARVGEA